MATETLSPSVDAIFFADAVRDDKLVITSHADIVVTGVTFETVIACMGRRNWVSTDIAQGCECQWAEDGVRYREEYRASDE
jgi:hypothetical protein